MTGKTNLSDQEVDRHGGPNMIEVNRDMGGGGGYGGSGGDNKHGDQISINANNDNGGDSASITTSITKPHLFSFLKTPRFYLVLFIGQMCAACTVSSSTFTTLLQQHGASLPAFQNFPNYFLMFATYGSYTIYKYGFKGWLQMIWKDGWKCEISPDKGLIHESQWLITISRLDILLL